MEGERKKSEEEEEERQRGGRKRGENGLNELIHLSGCCLRSHYT